MPTEGTDSTSIIPMIIFLVVIFAAMYFLMIRPRQKQQKEHTQLTQELKKGEKIITVGGIYGQIESVAEDTVVIKLESDATLRLAKSSIAGKQGAQQQVVERKSGLFG
jgi:preprotein translocase subunit YajC